jgi:hypothetical protein
MATVKQRVDVPAVVDTKLRSVRLRQSTLTLLAGLLRTLSLFLVALSAALLIDAMAPLFNSNVRVLLTTSAVGIAAVVFLWWVVRPLLRTRRLPDVARSVDEAVPDLQERWSTIAELSASSDPPEMLGSPSMIQKVSQEAADLSSKVDTHRVVTMDQAKRPLWMLAAIAGVLLAALAVDAEQMSVLFKRFCSPTSEISLTRVIAVNGNAVVPRNEPFDIEARLENRLRDVATLSLRRADGQIDNIELSNTGRDDVAFRHRLTSVDNALDYRYRSGDGQTPWHRIDVADRPQLSDIQFHITPPAYSKLPVQIEQGLPRRARALEGSRLEVVFHANEPLRSVRLKLGQDEHEELASTDSKAFHFSRTLDEALSITPYLTNHHGLTNQKPPTCRIAVYPDRAPTVKVVTPNDSIAVLPNDAVRIEFSAKDDLGILKAELVVYDGNAPDVELKVIDVPLGESRGAKEIRSEVILELNEFDLKHGAELAYALRVFDSKETQSTASTADRFENSTASNDSDASKMTGSLDQPGHLSGESQQTPAADSSAGSASPQSEQQNDNKTDQLADASNTERTGQPRDQQNSQGKQEVASRSSSAATGGGGSSSKSGNSKSGNSKSGNSKSGNSKSGNSKSGNSKSGNSKSGNSKSGNSKSGNSKSGNSKSGNSKSGNSKSGEKGTKPSQNRPNPSSADPQRKNNPQLDIPGQCTLCQQRRIKIDEWAGSFDSQARTALQMEIDPYLQQLDQALAAAEESIDGPLEHLDADEPWEAVQTKSVRSADGHLVVSEQVIGRLRSKSEGTPYAFVGLQLLNIGESHVTPARRNLQSLEAADVAAKREHLAKSHHHVLRAREMLARLTRRYETVKRNEKLAQEMQHLRKMYRQLDQDILAFLGTSKPTLNAYQRKIAELEVDEEYLKKFEEKFRELQERYREILAELSRILAEDPRLLARFMSMMQQQGDSLRDQLTVLARQQKELQQEVMSWKMATDGNRDEVGADIRARRFREAIEISEAASQMHDNMVVWTPRDLDPTTGEIAKLHALSLDLAMTATKFASAAAPRFESSNEADQQQNDAQPNKPTSTEDPNPASPEPSETDPPSVATSEPAEQPTALSKSLSLDKAEALLEKLKSFDSAVAATSESEDADEQLLAHLANRVRESRDISLSVAGWQQKVQSLQDDKYHVAAEVDQHAVTDETVALSRKLENLEAMLDEMPFEIVELARDLTQTLKYDLIVDQMSAELALRENRLSVAVEQQQRANESFETAEAQFDELMAKVIAELDAEAMENPDIADLDDIEGQTLEELLALLESEQQIGDFLGIPFRPTNLPGMPSLLPKAGASMYMSQLQMGRNNLSAMRIEDLARLTVRKRSEVKQSSSKSRRTRDNPRWNTLASQLEDRLRQGRGNIPPAQYRRAIERYFELLSERESESSE